ncbi:MAG: glucose-6-phosphate isomerase [Acidobacteriota bacterium]|nr:glucose-6-phosphate isomerase [Acidobacteriota bacterium]
MPVEKAAGRGYNRTAMDATDIRLSGFDSPGSDGAADLHAALTGLTAERAVDRIWARDWTLWRNRDEEISNRLGWLDAVDEIPGAAAEREDFVRGLRAEGFSHALVLGMGGSSLAPEVFARVFGPGPAGLRLDVLDSTDPAAVMDARTALPIDRTLFVVSSKSGSTLETSSLLSFFFAEVSAAVGPKRAGRSFAAITDPGSSLERLASNLAFRTIYLGDPNVGGRFSAFTAFGLVPAALLGADTSALLKGGRTAALACRAPEAGRNPGAFLGAILATAARRGLDKLGLFLPPRLASLGAWIEQLLAESTGKEGRGILPLAGRRPEDETAGDGGIVGEAGVLPVFLEAAGDEGWASAKDRAIRSGRPCVFIRADGEAGLGGQIFLWEFATAVAGRMLGVNPFDQPDVAFSKKRTTESLAEAVREGRIPMDSPDARNESESVWAGFTVADAAGALRRFAAEAKTAGYVVFQAFLPPRPAVRGALRRLALRFQAATGRPAAFDFGPRFLHSTGQLHKGDAGRGLFIQFSADHPADLAVPEYPGASASAFSFGTLIDAQAAGDRRALIEKGRRILAVRFHTDPAAGLDRLADSL